MKKIFSFVIVAYFLIFFAVAQSVNPEKTLSKINFIGLKHTKENILQKDFEGYIGQKASDELIKNIETELQVKNLFSDVQLDYSINENDECELNVTVKEKITFLPMPFVMVSSSAYMAGAFLMNMNVFGLGDMACVGVIFSDSTIFGMGMYSHRASVEAPGYSLFTQAKKATFKITDFDDDTVAEVDCFTVVPRARLNFKLNKYNALDVGFGYKGSFFEDHYGDFYDRNQFSLLSSWACGTQDWNGVFLSANSFGVNCEVSVDNKSRFVEEFSFSGLIQQPLLKDLRLNILYGGGIVLNGLVTDYMGEGSGCVSIINDGFGTDRIIGFTSGLEYAALKLKAGVFSVYGNYETAFAKDIDDSLVYCYGIGAGTKIYLAQISMPAFSFGLTYNISQSKVAFAMSLGMGM